MDLSKLSDYQLIKEINKSASNEAYLELKKRNEKSYYRTLSSYCRKVPQLAPKYDELALDVDLVLMKSIQSYSPRKKTKVNSWITSHSRFHILNTIRDLTELGQFVPTENSSIDLINNESHRYDYLDDKNQAKEEIFKLIDKMKDPRIKTIFQERFYGTKESSRWRVIAKKLNLTPQRVIMIFNQAKKELYGKMEKGYNK